MLSFLDTNGTYDVSLTVALATGLGVVAGAIAFGAVSRRRVRGLLPFGVVLFAAFATAASSPVNLSAGIGDKDERPLHARQLERSYEFGIGHYTVDLTDVALPPGTTKVDVALGIGDLLVRVPDDAALEIRGDCADGGQVTVLGKTDEGTLPDEHAAARGSTSAAPTLELEHDCLDAVAEAELLEDVRDVRLHGRVADVELLADLHVREALGDQAEDLLFARRQLVELLRRRRARRARELLDHALRDAGREQRVAGGDGADRGEQLLGQARP